VGKSAVSLAVGSLEAYSGKSAVILGIAHQLQRRGLDIAYTKPIGGNADLAKPLAIDDDAAFIAQTLNLGADRLQPSLLTLDPSTFRQRVTPTQHTNYCETFWSGLAGCGESNRWQAAVGDAVPCAAIAG
jgi:uncharacterized protein